MQDLIFMLIGIAFAILLVPTLINPASKMPRQSSVPTAILLFLLALNFLSDGYVLATVGNITTAAVWTLVAIFRS